MQDTLRLESLSILALFPALFIPIYPPCRTAIVFDYL